MAVAPRNAADRPGDPGASAGFCEVCAVNQDCRDAGFGQFCLRTDPSPTDYINKPKDEKYQSGPESQVLRYQVSCVACLEDSHCGAGELCVNNTCELNQALCTNDASLCAGLTPICGDTGACNPCSDGDCPEGLVCDPSGACLECRNGQDREDCPVEAPICGSDNTCRGCDSNPECELRNPNSDLCDDDTGQCVGCADADDCGGETPICEDGLCVACDADADNCDEVDDGLVCADSGACVECLDNNQCDGETPICGDDAACEACRVDTECAALEAGTPLCNLDVGDCRQCLTSDDCGDETPICNDAGFCQACGESGGDAACNDKDPALAACGESGECVECRVGESLQFCSGGEPICGADSTCEACNADAQCEELGAAFGPGICLDHLDGRCATEDETVRVMGADLQDAIDQVAGDATRTVVLVSSPVAAGVVSEGSITIVGQGPADIRTGFTANAALTVLGGEVFVRNLEIGRGNFGLVVEDGTVTAESVLFFATGDADVRVLGGEVTLRDFEANNLISCSVPITIEQQRGSANVFATCSE